IDAVRVRAINTELFTSGIEMNFPSSQAIINFPSLTLSSLEFALVLRRSFVARSYQLLAGLVWV
ncbi:MAG: hypothetical protein ACYT04_86870, partial [Nostoc sp.]